MNHQNQTNTKQVWLLSIGFLWLFFGFDGIQQHMIALLSEWNMTAVGYNSLILVYVSFVMFDPVAAYLVSKYNSKPMLVFGASFYALFTFALSTLQVNFIYLCAILLGGGASLLWTAQNTYLIRVSQKSVYGKNAGIFNALRTLGSGIGVICFGLLIRQFTPGQTMQLFTIIVLLGGLCFFGLKQIPNQVTQNHWQLIKKTFTNKTYLRLSMPFFLIMFLQGLLLGYLPELITNRWGIEYVGLITSIFFLVPLLLTTVAGSISDRVGRLRVIRVAYGFIAGGLIFIGSPVLVLVIGGVIFLAIASAILNPASMAIVGDIAAGEVVVSVTAFFWIMRNFGILGALILAKLLSPGLILPVSVAIVGITIIIYWPYLATKTIKN
ncbi:hypothetical protein A2W24_05565 [Microgenomates group bacterium RBG_16_45_19]|nr:MAG: hypothetical protein A2W24_05565 [Microgenomates group bacterium RBG_16_45_19]